MTAMVSLEAAFALVHHLGKSNTATLHKHLDCDVLYRSWLVIIPYQCQTFVFMTLRKVGYFLYVVKECYIVKKRKEEKNLEEESNQIFMEFYAAYGAHCGTIKTRE